MHCCFNRDSRESVNSDTADRSDDGPKNELDPICAGPCWRRRTGLEFRWRPEERGVFAGAGGLSLWLAEEDCDNDARDG